MKRAIVVIAAAAVLLAQTPVSYADEKTLTFKPGSMGEIENTAATKAGFRTRWFPYAHFGFTSFKASNGEGLTVLYADFESTQEAKLFLDWTMQRAFKVLCRETKNDPNGKAIEYRVELVPESDHPGVEVMWVVGGSVHVIRSQTLTDALELERQYGR